MGCVCTKSVNLDNLHEINREKGSRRSSRWPTARSRRDEVAAEEDDGDVGSESLILRSQKNLLSALSSDEGPDKAAPDRMGNVSRKRVPSADAGMAGEHILKVCQSHNSVEAELIAAGWPPWLTAVAGESVKGWLPRRADSFERLDKIGQGTYSNVYRARDLETGKIVALKKVRFVKMDPDSIRFMAREIHILRRLDHPNVVKLEGLIAPQTSCSLYLVFEYMEHDLTGLASIPGHKFTESQVKCFMQQLLLGLEHCHSRGVLHRDIKGSNLLIDNSGILRIADFGLATVFHSDQKLPLTSRVVTLWYRPPELLLGATEYGGTVDLWSTGCILAELFAGKPIMSGRTEVEQLHKIFKLCGSPSEEYWKKSKLPHATIFKPQHPYKRCLSESFKEFPSPALTLLDVLLAVEPANRGTATSALQSKFFNTSPLPCDPSSLPKYPPSKEYDAKLRNEEARRQRAAAKRHGYESTRRDVKVSKAAPVPHAHAELQPSLQMQRELPTQNSKGGNYNPREDTEFASIETRKGDAMNDVSLSGPLVRPQACGSSWNKKAKDEEIRTIEGQSLGSSRRYMRSSYKAILDPDETKSHSHQPDQELSNGCTKADRAKTPEKQEWSHNLLDRPSSFQKKSDKGHSSKKGKIHYSGPLMPRGGDIEEMLKEHEKQIQQAVRKAQMDRTNRKKKHDSEKPQIEAPVPGLNVS